MSTIVINRKKIIFAGLLMLMATGSAVSDEKLEARFQSVNKLLTESSLAKQVEANGSPEALVGRDAARAHYEEARQAEKSGDTDTANAELTKATQAMMKAVGQAGHESRVKEKKISDFSHREESINALLEAYNRVMKEKGKTAEAADLQELVKNNLAVADQLVAEGQIDQGRQLVDETYLATKVAVDRVRDGDTLVRSLNFASKEEEYHYELDRNDTHLMLVRVLLDEKMKEERISKRVQPLLGKAETLRKRAEKSALKSDFESAVELLEESTREVTRAIRMAGIYIPG